MKTSKCSTLQVLIYYYTCSNIIEAYHKRSYTFVNASAARLSIKATWASIQSVHNIIIMKSLYVRKPCHLVDSCFLSCFVKPTSLFNQEHYRVFIRKIFYRGRLDQAKKLEQNCVSKKTIISTTNKIIGSPYEYQSTIIHKIISIETTWTKN